MRVFPISPPPYKNKTIEPIRLIPHEARVKALARAGFNTFLLKSDDVFIDLQTDSGTGALSSKQKAAMEDADEAYTGSRSFFHMEKAIRDIFGYPFVVPAHQGRGAEHLLAQALIGKDGGYIPNNLYFTTSRFHQELAGGAWVNVAIPEAEDTKSTYPFKGNIDVAKLERFIKEKGAEHIPFVRIEASLNMAGGQPFSMENLCAVSELCRKHGIFLLLDATRVSENGWFIKEREKREKRVYRSGCYVRALLRSIVRDICDLTDGCTMSSKKDHYVPIGGFLATRNKALYRRAKELVVAFEGSPHYGGMAGHDMAALAVGIRESVDEGYIAHYLNQIAYLHEALKERGVPVVEPPGAHAVFIDAKRFLPHIPQNEFPAQTLAAEIYLESGVRTMERGIVSGQHGDEPYDGLELVRVTIPRRVYETAHLLYTAESIARAYKKRKSITRGLRMVYAPKELRFFQARFKRL